MPGTDTDIYVHELNATLTEVTPPGDLTTFQLYGFPVKDTADSPPAGITYTDPIIYCNAVAVVPADYTLTKATGRVVFDVPQGAADVITADYVWLLAATEIRDTTVFEFNQPQVRTVELDVNMKSAVLEPRFVDGVFSGTLEFQYMTQAQFAKFDHLYTAPNLTFDIFRTSMAAGFPYKTIAKCILMARPPYKGIPGGTKCQHVNLAVQQLESV